MDRKLVQIPKEEEVGLPGVQITREWLGGELKRVRLDVPDGRFYELVSSDWGSMKMFKKEPPKKVKVWMVRGRYYAIDDFLKEFDEEHKAQKFIDECADGKLISEQIEIEKE